MGKLVAAFQSQGRLRRRSPAPAPEVAEASGSAASDSGTLSPREEEVLREIARGMSNKEIARVLDIAETTVKIHVPAHPAQARPDLAVQAAVYASDRQRAE